MHAIAPAEDRSSRPGPAAASARERVGAASVALACLALLIVGARLRPAAAGHGTHEQLGLPACAFAQNFHLPCATCGMTTAVSLTAHGRLWEGFVTQPAGATLAIVAAGVFWAALHAAFFGSRPHRLLRPRHTTLLLWGGLALVLLAWGYKAIVWQA